jgi:hypothetical protein
VCNFKLTMNECHAEIYGVVSELGDSRVARGRAAADGKRDDPVS